VQAQRQLKQLSAQVSSRLCRHDGSHTHVHAVHTIRSKDALFACQVCIVEDA
jgi:hypothetical protein